MQCSDDGDDNVEDDINDKYNEDDNINVVTFSGDFLFIFYSSLCGGGDQNLTSQKCREKAGNLQQQFLIVQQSKKWKEEDNNNNNNILWLLLLLLLLELFLWAFMLKKCSKNLCEFRFCVVLCCVLWYEHVYSSSGNDIHALLQCVSPS